MKIEWLAKNDVWFAWRPVRLSNGRWTWWRWIRRRRSSGVPSGHGGVAWSQTEYNPEVGAYEFCAGQPRKGRHKSERD